jgi:hypothetical protein
MRTTKRNKDFAELVEQLTDLSDRDFREAIKIAKQFRKAQKLLQRAIIRQRKEQMPSKSTASEKQSIMGVDYEFASI